MQTAILGGGPAGLAVAHFLLKQNFPFNLYESSSETGGNAKTQKFDNFLYDTGAHRWHHKNEEMTDEIINIIGNDLKLINAPSKIFWNKKFISFPITPISLLKKLPFNLLYKIVIENFINQIKPSKEYSNFKEMAYSKYGKTLSDLFLINYSEKLWGLDCSKLVTEISGNRLKGLSLINLLKEIIMKNNFQNHLDGSFYYPKYGFGSIFNSIEKKINNESLHLNSSITSIFHNENEIKAIEINNEIIQKTNGKVISTLPINYFIKILSPSPPEDILDIANSIKFRGVLLTIIQLDKPQFSKNASIYFPEENIPFNRIYEPKNRSSKLAPANQTCIVVESSINQYEMEKTDTLAFCEEIKNNLLEINLITRKEIIKSKTIQLNYAYPIMDINSKGKMDVLLGYLRKFENISFIGRNSLFDYTHTHNLFAEAQQLVKNYSNPNCK